MLVENENRNLLRSLFYKTLGLFSAGVLLLCAWYFTVGINVWTSWVAVMIIVAAASKRRLSHLWGRQQRGSEGTSKPRLAGSLHRFVPITTRGIALTAIAIFCFVTILALCLGVRTGEAVVSPWNILPAWIFLPYGVGLLCTMLVGRFEENDSATVLGMCFTFVSTSVASIVYVHGFGFDPFLHRAAETALVQDGSIKPLQLLYSGQYALVAALHYVTFLPVKWIDIWLLPVLATWFLPLGATIGLRDGWGLSDTEARTWWPVILVIPFSLITFTVPFTLTFLFFLLFCFLWPVLIEHPSIHGGAGGGDVASEPRSAGSLHRFALILSFLAAAFFHPLLAVPMLVFCVGIWARNFRFIPLPRGIRGGRILAFATVIFLAASVPIMLFVSHAAGTPHLSSLIENHELFFNLFRSPYWDPYPFIPWTLQALYGFRYWLPMILFGGCLCYCTSTIARWKMGRANDAQNRAGRDVSVGVWIFALGMMATIWGTATLFSFKDIIDSEQSEFALRLLQALFTFPLPMLAVGFAALVRRWKWTLIPSPIIVASCVTIAWFFSYPQFNLKFPFFSPSVSDDDVTAVHDIDARSHGEPYLVLVHQMTSVAAIQEFGFSQMITLDGEQVLRYPIPTGGTLYPYYEHVIENNASRDWFDALQEKTGVAHIYFITHDYWDWSADMLQSLTNTADAHFREPSLTVWAYDYATY